MRRSFDITVFLHGSELFYIFVSMLVCWRKTCIHIGLKLSTYWTKNKILFSQVKTMRALQYFPTIEDPNARRALFEVLAFLLTFLLHLYENVWTIMILLSSFRFYSAFWWVLMLLKTLTRTMPHMLFSLKLLLWWVCTDLAINHRTPHPHPPSTPSLILHFLFSISYVSRSHSLVSCLFN